MYHLTDRQRIEVFIMLGCGDKTGTQKNLNQMFNNKYPDDHMSQSTVSRMKKESVNTKLL